MQSNSSNLSLPLPPGLSCRSTLDGRWEQIEKLPEELGKCVRLKVLLVNGNRLKSLPESIGSCRMIEELVVSENALDELLPTIGLIAYFVFSRYQTIELGSQKSANVCTKGEDFTGNDTRKPTGELQTNVAMIIWLMSRG